MLPEIHQQQPCCSSSPAFTGWSPYDQLSICQCIAVNARPKAACWSCTSGNTSYLKWTLLREENYKLSPSRPLLPTADDGGYSKGGRECFSHLWNTRYRCLLSPHLLISAELPVIQIWEESPLVEALNILRSRCILLQPILITWWMLE